MDYFKNSYRYEWRNTSQIGDLSLYQNAALPATISFSTPILVCLGCTVGAYGVVDLFEMNVKTMVYRSETRKVEFMETGMYRYETIPNTQSLVYTFYSGATKIENANNATYYANGGKAYLRKIASSINNDDKNTKKAGSWSDYYTSTKVLAQVPTEPNCKTISFNLPELSAVEIESGKGYVYTIECEANPITTNEMLSYYEAYHSGSGKFIPMLPVGSATYYKWTIGTNKATSISASSVKISTTFYQQDMSVVTSGGAFITKGVQYSAYELLRKALLTIDTQIIDNNNTSLDEYNNLNQPLASINYPIVLDELWNNRLKHAKIHETIFECKNLWEVLIQIGYYLHAIPYLEFATDGTDRFKLSFKQLGDTEKRADESAKITVFNSRNLSEYFTQYDSYVTNLFSPQNLVDEWIVCKTTDGSFLVSNNTAELHLSKTITELIAFDISMKMPNNQWETRSALENIFEKSIYDILSVDNPYQVYPTKGSSLYYSLGDNKIRGLNFVPPCLNSGDLPMALKRILQIVWQGTPITNVDNIKFNSLKFHVKYRTQETARISQMRPDIESFAKNSSLEKYPHHEQFYGQQDKIIDSERFTANLWGRLIRVGNAIYQRQEYISTPIDIKESGYLIKIHDDNYYVMKTESEYYRDAILQKVTYSKNFNQLANIVTIPSEPRFYEVSERAKVRREVRIMDFFALSTTKNTKNTIPRFLNNTKWKDFIKKLVFNTSQIDLPNYAWTRFKGDKFRPHWKRGEGSPIIPLNELFPSSLLDRSGSAVRPAEPSDHADCIVPLLHHPMHDGITFTWDMEDNFKAGDYVDNHIYYDNNITANDDAYLPMQPMRYVDVKGRADLFSFKLFKMNSPNTDEGFQQTRELPQALINITDDMSIAAVYGGDNMAIGLDKDGREEISFNYQINLLHRESELDSEDFITFPNLFGIKETTLSMCFLSEVQSLFNENVNITQANILADNVQWQLIDDDSINAIELRIIPPNGVDVALVKSIVLYESNKIAYIIKNVSRLPNPKKLQSWWIYPVLNL